MCDNWEDWEDVDFNNSFLNFPTKEQSKRLEEQRLIEESDIELAKELMGNNKKENNVANNNFTSKEEQNKKIKYKQNKLINKRNENNEKNQNRIKKLQEDKEKKIREHELFGYVELDNKYAEYEDKFY